MPNYRRIIQYTLLVCLVMLVFAAPASAADVLATIRNRAASLLIGLKPVIFILAGFGLIGFAWMAIFNQISWKWFSNIAIGLFLVANMGLFLDYFATKSGDGKKYTQMLGSDDYKDNMGDGYQETPGADGDPSTQVPGSAEGPAGPSGSDELDSAFAELKDEKTCSDAGGTWSNGKCSSSSSQSGTDTERNADNAAFEQELAQNKDQASCTENSGVWENNSCKASWAVGEGGTSFTERLECANSGGNWDGKKCIKNSSTTPPAGSGGGSDIINPPVDNGNATDTTASAQAECEAKGSVWANGQCYSEDNEKVWDEKSKKFITKAESDAKECKAKGKGYVFQGGKCLTESDACVARGDFWNDKKCISQEEKQKNDNKEKDKECKKEGLVNQNGTCVSEQIACEGSGKVWTGKDCISQKEKEEDDDREKSKDCKQQGLKNLNGKCVTEGEYCTSYGLAWTGTKCISQEEQQKNDNKEKDKDCKKDGLLNLNGECVSPQVACDASSLIWDGKSCITRDQYAEVKEAEVRQECNKQNLVFYNSTCISQQEYCGRIGQVWDGKSDCITKEEHARLQCVAEGKTFYEKRCVSQKEAACLRSNGLWRGDSCLGAT